jgi:hypothetical protein
MKKFNQILDFIIAYMLPGYWYQQNPYNKQWDIVLNKLLNKHDFSGFRDHTAMLGNIEVWISNHPYASFSPYKYNVDYRPSRLTIRKAYKKYIKQKKAHDMEVFMKTIKLYDPS